MAASAWEDMRHREVGKAQVWYHSADRMLMIWGCFLLPDGLLGELIESVENKRKLSRVIDLDDARDFTVAVRSFGEILPSPLLLRPHSRSPVTSKTIM